ncbi:hypothetical protein KOW79_014869 [Hemibagrus wyckioides]|uniref:Uncharacterized protein n=1 Tax=Hemibagrus wyckioides TaxID=337641 RepID=A0A9D3SF35_9TELE|nr:NLR family CARD domain-containing protein 3 [Hemibagrus wyckioides]KAG7322011.1 hypothetical protein KOW79_014869 [Hemibagrus wyckioides]
MSDNDSEVERTMMGRPPSSYGSMCSDEPEDDDDDFEEVQDAASQPVIKVNLPTRIKLHRPDSPETGVTSITQDQRTSVHNEGVYITAQRRQPNPGEVNFEMEDNESSVPPIEPQDSERMNIQMELNDPEPTPAACSTDELALPYIFTAMVNTLRNLNNLELQCFVHTLCSQCDGQLKFQQLEQEGEIDVLGVVDRMMEKWDKAESLYITIRTLYDINKRAHAAALESVCRRAWVQFGLRASHKRRYYSLYEGICRPGQQRYIRQVYVESPIVLEIPRNEGRSVRTSDLFSPLEDEGRVRVVLTTGVPAVGLSVAIQMFLMDWTEEQTCQDFQFVFALPGRDLHLVRNSDQTFLEFLAAFYPETKQAEFLACQDCPVLFVFDALELCRHPLNFENNPSITEITTRAPVDALLTSLIKGDLLPHASIWITAHQPTCQRIPKNCISRFTELKGFGDAQKDEYFTKRTRNPTLGRSVLDQVRGCPGLYDACYFPLFSWIVSVVYEQYLPNQGSVQEMPTLTTFYAQYVIVLTNRKIERYVGTGIEASRWTDADKNFLMKMGELALRMLNEKKNIFYEDSVARLALDIQDVTHRGGISFETAESSRENRRSFMFVHHSIQKFMAAVYVYVRFRMTGENVFESRGRTRTERPVNELYKPIIDTVLASRDAYMDLFLRFLLGLVAEATEIQLRGRLLPQHHPKPRGVEDVLRHVRKKIKENAIPERCRNLELCLSELEERRNVR